MPLQDRPINTSPIGHDILAMSSNPVFHLAAEIALGHHEKWDGNG
jgi:putative two-component system response regulator